MVESMPVCGVGSANPGGGNVVVVLEATPYCRKIEADGNRMFFHLRSWPDARKKKYFRGVERTG